MVPCIFDPLYPNRAQNLLLTNFRLTSFNVFGVRVGKLRTWDIDRTGKIPKSAHRRMQKVFWTQGARSLLHRCNPTLHRCKSSFGWRKRLFGDLCSDLLHPPVSTFGNFPFSGNFSGPQLPKVRGPLGGLLLLILGRTRRGSYSAKGRVSAF